MKEEILLDALYAAIAAIGFAAISRPPRRVYLYCAAIAASGHSLRFILMNDASAGMHIFTATLIASLFMGAAGTLLSPLAKTPAEACIFPSLLPMIPGMYAYKAFGGLALCVLSNDQADFGYCFYQFAHNGMICIAVLLAMVTGATLPVFILKKISFQATR